MGNTKHFKGKTTPKRSYPNGYEYEGGTIPEKVTFFLVQIDRSNAKSSKPGDSINLIKSNVLEVHSNKGRIGNVPPTKTEIVESSGLTNGTIVDISNNFDRIKIQLNE